MVIEVKGRNVSVTDDLREHVDKRFRKIANQVSELARLEVEIRQERNPSNPEGLVVEATLSVKGTVLRARDTSRDDFKHAVNLVEEELSRQVKRHRDKRRRRREARAASPRHGVQPAL